MVFFKKLITALLCSMVFALWLPAQTLYWLDASFSSPVIGMSDADGSNIHAASLTASSLPEALEFSPIDNTMLWTELTFSGAHIQSTDTLLASTVQIINDGSALRGIAVDRDSDWIYYATSNLQTQSKIMRVHPDGTGEETFLLLDAANGNPRALAIDTVSRKLYWTEFSQGTINSVDLLSGATSQTIVAGLNGPVGLALDHNADKMYWAEANANTIKQSNLNGSSVTTILSGLATPNFLTIDTTDGYLYWTEISTPRIRKATTAGNLIETLPITVSHPTGIRFVSQEEIMLPVELSLFTASMQNKSVELTWKTATEVNNYGFEIERMTPTQTLPLQGGGQGRGWSKIGFVEGSGTTNSPKSYSFVDANANGTILYRLKQIDRDGKFTYSHEVEVTVATLPTEFALQQNYPNPFNPTTQIGFTLPVSGFTTLKIYDVVGNEVAILMNETKEAGRYTVPFNGTNLSSGIYFYRLKVNNFTATKKLVLMK
jgi:hypothetical protein